MEKMIYLDNAATTKTRPEVVEAMLPYFTESYGNPSSVYTFSAKSKEAVTKAREIIADSLGVKSNEIYFTAGGSEADNWALVAAAEAYEAKGKHIITSKIEHHAILHTCEYLEKRGYEVTYLDVDENQIIRDVKFKTFGCGAAVATSSMATELVIGKTIEEAMKVTNKAVMEALDGLPPVKVHCSLLAEEAIHAALWDYAQKNHIVIEGLSKPKSDIHEGEEEAEEEY